MVVHKIFVLMAQVQFLLGQPHRDDVKLRTYTLFAIFAPQVKIIIIFTCGVCVYIMYIHDLTTLR